MYMNARRYRGDETVESLQVLLCYLLSFVLSILYSLTREIAITGSFQIVYNSVNIVYIPLHKVTDRFHITPSSIFFDTSGYSCIE